ncbi:MAG: O-methyltransferase [Lachnospiraceae bacterium]|nr:O-methyltransferase [Lachnospiraceae bacterium]
MDEKRLVTFIDTLSWQIPEELKILEKEALADEVPIIRRSMQSLLAFLIRMKRPERILEIGTAVGFSGILMLSYAGRDAHLDTIEKVPARIKGARENFKRFAVGDRVCLYEEDAEIVLKRLVSEKKKYDFIFMDAAKGQYESFLRPILEMLSEDGMLVTDNVLQNGDVLESRYAITKRDRTIHKRMRSFLYTLTHTEGWNTVILPVGDGVALTTFSEPMLFS